jgi:ABC-type transporter Mla subunit MlaD
LLLATLADGLRIAYENEAAIRAELDRTRTALADELDDRHRSERELIDRVAGLVDQLERMQQQLTGANAVRTVLNGSRAGRVALRALRPAWRLARGVRLRIRPSAQR